MAKAKRSEVIEIPAGAPLAAPQPVLKLHADVASDTAENTPAGVEELILEAPLAEDGGDPWTDAAIVPAPNVRMSTAEEEDSYKWGPPPRDHGYRVFTGVEWNRPLAVLTITADGKKTPYIVGANVAQQVLDKYKLARLWTLCWWQNTQRQQGLWWTHPGFTDNTWLQSAQIAVSHARKIWVRTDPDTTRGRYPTVKVPGNLPDPTWPQLKQVEVLKKAFGDRIITRMAHPVLLGLGDEELTEFAD